MLKSIKDNKNGYININEIKRELLQLVNLKHELFKFEFYMLENNLSHNIFLKKVFKNIYE